MGIVFFCQSCGARFEVDARMAGKKGHCKKCGQMMSIPHAEQIASMTSIPALVGAGVSEASIGSAMKMDLSQIKLDALTLDRVPIGSMVSRPSKPSSPTAMSVLDDSEDSKPYLLAVPLPKSQGRVSSQANVALSFWRGQVWKVQKLLRSVHGAAYLFSVPFIVLFLIGVVLKSRSTALLGATGMVVLAIGGIAAGIANLATVPLRDGFDGKKLKKPLRRVLEPLGAIVVVVVAFAFIPWLSNGAPAKGNIRERLKSSAKSLRQEMKGQLGKAASDVENIDIEKLGEGVQKKLTGANETLKDIGKRARGTAEEPQN